MKPRFVAAVFCLWGAMLGCDALGEVHVSLRLEHRSTLLFEPVRAYLTFYNDSDYPYIIDATRDAPRVSRFAIEVRRGSAGSPVTEESAPVRYLYLMPDEREEVMLDLTAHYAMTAMGRYSVKAVTSHHGEIFESKQSLLDVVRGIDVAKAVRSIPNYPGCLRSYTLKRWSRSGEGHLFLSVDDTEGGYNHGVYDLGRLIAAGDPVVRVDRNGNVVVAHQCSPDCFIRTFLRSTREKVSLVDQTYHLPSGEPYPLDEKNPSPRLRRRQPARQWWQFWKWGRS